CLDDRGTALVEQLDLERVGVDTDDGVAVGGQTRGRPGADVTEAEHADFHEGLPGSSCRVVTRAWPRPTRPAPSKVNTGSRTSNAGEDQPAGGSVCPRTHCHVRVSGNVRVAQRRPPSQDRVA